MNFSLDYEYHYEKVTILMLCIKLIQFCTCYISKNTVNYFHSFFEALNLTRWHVIFSKQVHSVFPRIA